MENTTFFILLCSSCLVLGALGVCVVVLFGSGSKNSGKRLEDLNRQFQIKIQSLEDSTAALRKLLSEREAEAELLRKAEKDFEQRTSTEIASLRDRAPAMSNLPQLETQLQTMKQSVELFEQKVVTEISSLKDHSQTDFAAEKFNDEFLQIKEALKLLEQRIGPDPVISGRSDDVTKAVNEPVKQAATGISEKPPVVPLAAPAAEPSVKVPPGVAIPTLDLSAGKVIGKIIYDEPKKETTIAKPQESAKPIVVVLPKAAEEKLNTGTSVVPESSQQSPEAQKTPSTAVEAPKTNSVKGDPSKSKTNVVNQETVDDILALLQGKKPKGG